MVVVVVTAAIVAVRARGPVAAGVAAKVERVVDVDSQQIAGAAVASRRWRWCLSTSLTASRRLVGLGGARLRGVGRRRLVVARIEPNRLRLLLLMVVEGV